MIELRAEPYSLKYGDFKKDEKELRAKLNLKWCRGALFNIRAFKNNANKVEYDAVLYNDDAVLFIEYKNTVKSYKNLKAKRVQQIKDDSRDVARAFGFRKYDFIIVVKHLEESMKKMKGDVKVISLEELNDYMHEIESFKSTFRELDYIDGLLSRYNRKENPVDFRKEQVLKELNDLRNIIDQVNR